METSVLEPCKMADKNQNLLTAYSFLSALTENRNDLYNNVFVPICKRALSLYLDQRKTHGSIQDIQEIFMNEFGMSVPLAVIKKLLKSVYQQMSKKERIQSGFELIGHEQHFSINKYAFKDLDNKARRSRREAVAVQKAFEVFLHERQIPLSEVPTFAEFLQRNNSRLATFFVGKESINGELMDKSFYHHIEFLQHIESINPYLYSIIEAQYLGSIVVSFLEADFDFEPKFISGEIYYLDTPFLLRVLDLQREDACKAAMELINLIKSTGGELKVLSITVDELRGILERAISNYDARNPTTTINEACQRRGINKAFLIQIADNLEAYLTKNIGLSIVNLPNRLRDKFLKSSDLKLLQEKRVRAGTAEHDVQAYLYVREERNGVVKSFQKAKIWLLTTNIALLNFNRNTMPYQGVSEIVLPDALTSLLWLRDPAKLTGKVKQAGLNELMSVALNEEVVSKELITEFESAISTIPQLSKDQYGALLNSVAYESARRIEKFIDKTIYQPKLAAIEAQSIIEKERRRKSQEREHLKNATIAIKKEQESNIELSERFKEIENELIEFGHANQSLRATNEEQIAEIRKLKSQMQERTRLYRRAFISLLIAVVLVIMLWLVNHNMGILIQKWLKYILNIVTSLSGLWSFCSFILNFVKAFRK